VRGEAQRSHKCRKGRLVTPTVSRDFEAGLMLDSISEVLMHWISIHICLSLLV